MDTQRLWREHSRELISVAFYLVLLLFKPNLVGLRSGTLILLSAASFLALLIINGSRFYRFGGLLLPPGLLLLYRLSDGLDPFPLVLSLFFLHLAVGGPRAERPFLQLLFSRLRAVGWAIGFTLAVYLFIQLLLWVMGVLFGLRLWGLSGWLVDFVIALVAPLALLYFRDRSGAASPLHRVCRGLGDLVLFIYGLIIYGYIAQILLRQELFNGEVVQVLLPFLIGGLYLQGWHRAANEAARTPSARDVAIFYRWLNWLNLAPLLLLAIAIKIRIDHYGLTMERIQLLILAGLLVLANGLLLLPQTLRARFQVYRLILALLAATALADGYLIPYHRWSQASQRQRLERLLNENGLLRAGQMDWDKFREFSRDPAHEEALKQIRDVRKYLDSESPFGIGTQALEENTPATRHGELSLKIENHAPLSLPAGTNRLLLLGDRYRLDDNDIRTANPAAVLPELKDWQRHFEEQLQAIGLDKRAPLDKAQQEKLLPRLRQLEFQGQVFAIAAVNLRWEEEKGWQVQDFRYEAYAFSAPAN